MQHFWYCIKMTLRSKMGMFWALVFPILLGTVFYFMFDNIANEEQFAEVGVGIILEEENDTFVSILQEVEADKDLKLFEVTEYDCEEDAENALKQGDIYGYIIVDGEEYSLVVKKMNTYSSLIKSFLDQYKQNHVLIESVAEEHPERIEAFVADLLSGESIGIEEISLKGEDKSPYTQYFYALLAMSCMMGCMSGMTMGLDLQADLSFVGMRRNVAPTKKMRQVVSDFLATFFLYGILMTIVLFFLVYVCKQDFGGNLGLILLVTWVGSFTGIAGGIAIAVLSKGSRSKKEGLCVAFFMGSSGLAGLFVSQITYILEKTCPIINRINPATLIVNAFKSLAVFGDYRRYAVNLVTLFIIGVLLIILSVFKLRRTKYASL